MMYRIFKTAQTCKKTVFETENETEALQFCEINQWQLTDEHGFVWDLEYEEIP